MHHCGNVDGKIRSAVSERYPGFKRGIGIDHRGSYSLMILAHCLFERVESLVNGVRLHENFCRSSPNHYQPIALILFLETLDVVDNLLGEVEFILATLYVRAGKSLYVSLIEHGLHRLNLLQRGSQLRQQILFKHTRMHRCLVC